jgi:hypothetical protein
MSSQERRPQRLLWIVNHKTLIPAEVPLLRDLGYEVFIPKIIPDFASYRSGEVTWEHDATLSIPRAALDVLNAHEFYGPDYYGRQWSATLRHIINTHFDVLITSMSAYVSPLRESVHWFHGLIMARAFGLVTPQTYAAQLEWLQMTPLLKEIASLGSRFVFAQGYANLAEIEPPALRNAAHTITLPLPPRIFSYEGSWRGTGDAAILLCPAIEATGYYRDLYQSIKRDFGGLPHRIFGRQVEDIPDPNVLPYLSDEELIALYAETPVFIYPSVEPRHIHYSPLEAMVVGAPVLYRRGALTDVLAEGADLPGACASTEVMRNKAERLLAGDRDLAKAICASQGRIVKTFAADIAREQWAKVLDRRP